ncbi:MAG: ARPP-1 family domain-containing protein [Pyrinomonadaceae bacterium]
MNTHTRARLSGLALFVAALTLACATTAQVRQPTTAEAAAAADYTVSGPYTHKNLSVFLVRAKDKTADGGNFLTLQEALQQKKVVVYETRNVNELAIENVSGEDVFVQSGDIVKGGQQDRMLAIDLVVQAHSGRIAISAFCVEHGRWTKRGAEAAAQFSTSTDRAATKDLKLAARSARSQGQVWAKVEEAQSKLSHNVGGAVNSDASPTSLQLSLENPKVRATADEYVRALTSAPVGDADVVGYAFAVNGQINSAEVYASHALFLKLWSGLLKASAVEAVAELQPDAKSAPEKSAADVRAFLSESEKADAKQEAVGARVQLVTRESKSNVMFETRSTSGASASKMVHKSYIKKE